MGTDMGSIMRNTETSNMIFKVADLQVLGIGEEFTKKVQEILYLALEEKQPTSPFVQEQIEKREAFGLCFLKGIIQSQHTMILQKLQEFGDVSEVITTSIISITGDFLDVLERQYYISDE